MGMEIALIPAAMFIVGIGMMIYMKKKRDSLAPGYAQQEMKRFVKEMVPQLSEEEFHVIDCPWNAEHHFVIAYTDESIFFIPALPNPMTMKIMKYSGERGAGLGSLVSHTILGSDSADGVEMVPASAVSGVEIDESAREVRIAVADTGSLFLLAPGCQRLAFACDTVTLRLSMRCRRRRCGVCPRLRGSTGRSNQHRPHGASQHDHHRQQTPTGLAHVNPVSTVRRSSARNSLDCISLSRDTVRGNSCASGPSVYSCSGGTAADRMSLTRRSYSTSTSQVNRRAGDAMLTGM